MDCVYGDLVFSCSLLMDRLQRRNLVSRDGSKDVNTHSKYLGFPIVQFTKVRSLLVSSTHPQSLYASAFDVS